MQLATMPVSGGPQHPSVRTVVFRGFAGQPRKEDEPTGGNPIKDVTSSLIVCSTDRRMLKADQIAAQQEGQNPGFEVCWWHQGTQEQIRFSGNAWLLTPSDQENPGFPADRLKSLISVPDGQTWTWEGERLRQFAKHSPGLRGTFANPHPASPLTPEKQAVLEKGIKLPGSLEEANEEEEKDRVKTALSNFCLVVLECQHVEYLKVDPPPSRKQWIFSGKEWTAQDVSP